MHSNLVRSTRLRIALDHGLISILIIADKLKESRRTFSLWSVLKWHLTLFSAGPSRLNIRHTVDAQIHRHWVVIARFRILWLFISLLLWARLPEVAHDSRIVHLGHFVINHGLSEVIRTFLFFCKEDDARCLPIEPVHSFQPRIAQLNLCHFQ